MYKIFNGVSWILFENYEQLLNWLSKHNETLGTEFSNKVLEKVGNCDNDTYRVWKRNPDIYSILGYSIVIEYEKRNYRILDEFDKSIYDSELIKDVRNWEYSDDVYRQWIKFVNKNRKKRSKWVYLRECDYPDFRRGPWPNIRKRRGGCGYRSIKTYNEMKMSADPEMKSFNRGSRGKNLPTAWDDICRDWRNDGWKHQGKNRYQWEHKVKEKYRHTCGKGAYVVKRDKLPEYVDYEFEFEDIA